MAKFRKGFEDVNIGMKTSSTGGSKSSVGPLRPDTSQAASNAPAVGKSTVTLMPTHQQIEERAKVIWRHKGCPAGQDASIWFEAEAQLKEELAAK